MHCATLDLILHVLPVRGHAVHKVKNGDLA